MSVVRTSPSKGQDFAESFDLAKQALAYIGQFQTAPTPHVYEVWYRFVEGKNKSICQQLSHAVGESKEVSQEFLEQLYEQFCTSVGDQVSDQIGSELSDEMAKLQGLIDTQLTAGDEFRHSIVVTNDALTDDSDTTSEISACVMQLLESNRKMQSELQVAHSQLEASRGQIHGLRQNLVESQKSMMTDPLTGVGNRRYFDTLMQKSVAGVGEQKEPLFLLLIDLDEFKVVNDTLGHAAGDEVLKYVASEIQNQRPDASLARYGGDEFGLFLSSVSVDEATELADAIRRSLATHPLQFANNGQVLHRICLSIGVARLREDDTTESWFDRADQLLYRAKESGRNCVMVERILDA